MKRCWPSPWPRAAKARVLKPWPRRVSRKLSASVGRERFAPTLTGRECSEPSPASAFPSRTFCNTSYTGDARFLRARAYPWCREIGECLFHLLKPDARGTLTLPLSSSPEIFDNTRRAFLIPNSNSDLMSLKMLFRSLAEMAAASGDPPEPEAQPAAPPNAAEPVVLPGAGAK